MLLLFSLPIVVTKINDTWFCVHCWVYHCINTAILHFYKHVCCCWFLLLCLLCLSMLPWDVSSHVWCLLSPSVLSHCFVKYVSVCMTANCHHHQYHISWTAFSTVLMIISMHVTAISISTSCDVDVFFISFFFIDNWLLDKEKIWCPVPGG